MGWGAGPGARGRGGGQGQGDIERAPPATPRHAAMECLCK